MREFVSKWTMFHAIIQQQKKSHDRHTCGVAYTSEVIVFYEFWANGNETVTRLFFFWEFLS